jgi:hypothetical protein
MPSSRLRFRVHVTIHSLEHIPYARGFIMIKWKTKGHKHEGITATREVTAYTCHFNEDFEYEQQLSVNKKTNIVQSEILRLSVRQDLTGRDDFERMGIVEIDLAQFAGTREITTIFLLKESKVNSSLRVTVRMRLIAGDPVFKCPSGPNALDLMASRDEGSLHPYSTPDSGPEMYSIQNGQLHIAGVGNRQDSFGSAAVVVEEVEADRPTLSVTGDMEALSKAAKRRSLQPHSGDNLNLSAGGHKRKGSQHIPPPSTAMEETRPNNDVVVDDIMRLAASLQAEALEEQRLEAKTDS